jgi:hypothetical protein
MEYCIEVENDTAVGRPVLVKDKLVGRVYAPLTHTQAPQLGPYETDQTVQYKKIDDRYMAVWSCRTMSQEEQQQKQNRIKTTWVLTNSYPSWRFDENMCAFEAPAPMPTDNKPYRWDEALLSRLGIDV